MIVHDLNISGPSLRSAKADPVRIVHANAVLPRTITRERLESVAGRHTKILQPSRDLKLSQLASSHRYDTHESTHAAAGGERLRVGIPDGQDHLEQ